MCLFLMRAGIAERSGAVFVFVGNLILAERLSSTCGGFLCSAYYLFRLSCLVNNPQQLHNSVVDASLNAHS